MANFEESHDDSGERLELLVSSLITAFTVLSEELRETSNKPSAAHQAASPNNFETQDFDTTANSFAQAVSNGHGSYEEEEAVAADSTDLNSSSSYRIQKCLQIGDDASRQLEALLELKNHGVAVENEENGLFPLQPLGVQMSTGSNQCYSPQTSPRPFGSASPGLRPFKVLSTRRPTLLDEQTSPETSLVHDELQIEHDFTTPGTQGALGCPFATMDGPKPGSHSLSFDPIAAEFHRACAASPPPSATGSASKCPIRFLSRHSPEELAAYFENHKHEIPRSHEVCVKRYQSNEESIRQLDAKYGSLVSMIQGLGAKHQPMLPAERDETDPTHQDGNKANERVEKWAEDVSASSKADMPAESVADEERESRFERPLKEIRVGESPSRPWGISVPLSPTPKLAPSLPDEHFKLDKEPSVIKARQALSEKPKRCPFPHDAVPLPKRDDSNKDHHEQKVPGVEFGHSAAFIRQSGTEGQSSQQPKGMVFTGPVFIGYPIEQAIALADRFVGRKDAG